MLRIRASGFYVANIVDVELAVRYKELLILQQKETTVGNQERVHHAHGAVFGISTIEFAIMPSKSRFPYTAAFFLVIRHIRFLYSCAKHTLLDW